jgi:hypothetical protein
MTEAYYSFDLIRAFYKRTRLAKDEKFVTKIFLIK